MQSQEGRKHHENTGFEGYSAEVVRAEDDRLSSSFRLFAEPLA